MHIHILGICGTFMGGIAQLAVALGHRVTGSDANVYPPMSTQLEAAGIGLCEGWDVAHLDPAPDIVVIGNAMSRGNPLVEYVLERGLRYASGPQWLAEHLLADRWVLAAAGTHGKTTVSGMIAWILECADLQPGFLIGGVPLNFGVSARLGNSPFFVVEADEYDTAFFDKRSKFVHYHARTLVMNNLEFDHADIFDDLGMIQRQFHHLVRTVPGNGLIVTPSDSVALDAVLDMGCWTPLERFGVMAERGWGARDVAPDGGTFEVTFDGRTRGRLSWGLTGLHNVNNALAALAASRHAGVPIGIGLEALATFRNARRRMEVVGEVDGVRVYDDFAHHPSAIAATLHGLRAHVGGRRIIAILDPRSNTMRMGAMADRLPDSLADADRVFVHAPDDLDWDASAVFRPLGERVEVLGDVDAIVTAVAAIARSGDQLLVMSNGGFGGIHQKLLDVLM